MKVGPMKPINRRSFLAGLGGTALAGGGFAAGRFQQDPEAPAAITSRRTAPMSASTTSTSSTTAAAQGTTTMASPVTQSATSDFAKRRLVVIELGGGNDGLSTLIPAGTGAYRDLRPNIAIPEDQLLWWDDEVAVHANLKRMNDRGMAAIQGLGSTNPDGSHFAMMARWWAGQPESDTPASTGFFGRLCDALGDPAAPYVGVCVGQGNHPAMRAAKVSTLGLPDVGSAGYVAGANKDDEFRQRFQRALSGLASGPVDDVYGEARRTLAQAIAAAERLHSLEEGKVEYPGSELGSGLSTAARLLQADDDVRVIYVPAHMNFDTHSNHAGTHAANLDELDKAMDTFLNDIGQRGLGDQVLVATVSEFGRRVAENGEGGLDHGAASMAFLAGAVKPGRYGQYSSLTDLDEAGNLKATVGFDRYYATLAESWFGVPAGDVLDTGARPLDDVSF
jgi:uncharacterized protein (DUF1501 family)